MASIAFGLRNAVMSDKIEKILCCSNVIVRSLQLMLSEHLMGCLDRLC